MADSTASVSQAAELIGCSRKALYEAIKRGKVPASQPLGPNSTWKVDVSAFLAKSERCSETDTKTG